MKTDLWVVGLFNEGEIDTFGPFTKETAELFFKKLTEKSMGSGITPFIRKLKYPEDMD